MGQRLCSCSGCSRPGWSRPGRSRPGSGRRRTQTFGLRHQSFFCLCRFGKRSLKRFFLCRGKSDSQNLFLLATRMTNFATDFQSSRRRTKKSGHFFTLPLTATMRISAKSGKSHWDTLSKGVTHVAGQTRTPCWGQGPQNRPGHPGPRCQGRSRG